MGSQIVWVRLQGLFQTLFLVGWYIPHKYRSEPDQMDTSPRFGFNETSNLLEGIHLIWFGPVVVRDIPSDYKERLE